MIDVTDGLLIDLKRVLTASRVGARLYKAFVPVSRRTVSFDSAVSEGEDFELLFTMGRREAARLGVTVPGMRTAVTMIGEVTGIRDGLMIVAKDGTWRKAEAEGYLHF
jgi:thiamine-monophosphate kinase